MNCPRCKSINFTKAGNSKGKQRYKCKTCNYFYTVNFKSTAKSNFVKRVALEMYLEGLGFNSIARILEVSHVSIQQWVKVYGKELEELKNNADIELINLSEVYTYLTKKKQSNNAGLLLIDINKKSSKSFWIFGKEREVRSYGKKNRIKKSKNNDE